MKLASFLAALATAAILAPIAQAETYADCAKFDEPLAYNNCLASHGPAAGHVRSIAAPEGKSPMRGAQSGPSFRRVRGGRVHATFLIDDARAAHRPKSPHP